MRLEGCFLSVFFLAVFCEFLGTHTVYVYSVIVFALRHRKGKICRTKVGLLMDEPVAAITGRFEMKKEITFSVNNIIT